MLHAVIVVPIHAQDMSQDLHAQDKKEGGGETKNRTRTPYKMTERAFEDVFTHSPVTLFWRRKVSIMMFEPDTNCFAAYKRVMEGGSPSPHTRAVKFPSPPSDARAIYDQMATELKEPDRVALVIINPSWMPRGKDDTQYDPKIDNVRLKELAGPLVGRLAHEQQCRVVLLVLSQPGRSDAVVKPLLEQPCFEPDKTKKVHGTPSCPVVHIGALCIDTITFA